MGYYLAFASWAWFSEKYDLVVVNDEFPGPWFSFQKLGAMPMIFKLHDGASFTTILYGETPTNVRCWFFSHDRSMEVVYLATCTININ